MRLDLIIPLLVVLTGAADVMEILLGVLLTSVPSYALVVLALINTVLSLYHYLRVIAPMFVQPPGEAFSPASAFASSVAIASAAILGMLGVFAFLMLDQPPALILFV